ncbi:hypothetical protein HQ865_13615 [Mucilaginibacter mali]|uniref:Uncharacterized protein n=1 Tax=Mucilaginibacter mali TaxID=2740462 RepID=A0A7D4QAE3_9SPHI|nr:hypothetical protein [Mucilaginibacter mali]QKJ30745.1 hypothetical protein HQ865_13615 [Mucilaginibacter mali]
MHIKKDYGFIGEIKLQKQPERTIMFCHEQAGPCGIIKRLRYFATRLQSPQNTGATYKLAVNYCRDALRKKDVTGLPGIKTQKSPAQSTGRNANQIKEFPVITDNQTL